MCVRRPYSSRCRKRQVNDVSNSRAVYITLHDASGLWRRGPCSTFLDSVRSPGARPPLHRGRAEPPVHTAVCSMCAMSMLHADVPCGMSHVHHGPCHACPCTKGTRAPLLSRRAFDPHTAYRQHPSASPSLSSLLLSSHVSRPQPTAVDPPSLLSAGTHRQLPAAEHGTLQQQVLRQRVLRPRRAVR
jgi:hypothetical protein